MVFSFSFSKRKKKVFVCFFVFFTIPIVKQGGQIQNPTPFFGSSDLVFVFFGNSPTTQVKLRSFFFSTLGKLKFFFFLSTVTNASQVLFLSYSKELIECTLSSECFVVHEEDTSWETYAFLAVSLLFSCEKREMFFVFFLNQNNIYKNEKI